MKSSLYHVIKAYFLLQFFFTLFSDPEKDPPQLNYTDMLLYFASHPDAVEGVYQALSVATGTQIQRKKDKFSPVPCLVKVLFLKVTIILCVLSCSLKPDSRPCFHLRLV